MYNIFGSFPGGKPIFEFPEKERVEKLKEQGKLNQNTFVEVNNWSRASSLSLSVFWKATKRSRTPAQHCFWIPLEREWLGDMNASGNLLHFLDKFGKTIWERIDQKILDISIKILTLRRKEGIFVSWRIEYGLLVAVWELDQKDSARLETIVKKARNKKELKILLGVR